jgi:hypothetical protein
MFWRKKKWIIIGVTAGVLILVVGILGVVSYAQTTTTPAQPDPSKTIIGRVATILGVDQAKVQAAFDKAQKDQQTEAATNRLNDLVKQGKLTQQQADDYGKWLQSRPNTPSGLALPNGPMMGPKGHMGFPGMRGFRGNWNPNAPAPSLPPPPTATK